MSTFLCFIFSFFSLGFCACDLPLRYDYNNPNDAQNFVGDEGDGDDFYDAAEDFSPTSQTQPEGGLLAHASMGGSLDLVQAPRKVDKVWRIGKRAREREKYGETEGERTCGKRIVDDEDGVVNRKKPDGAVGMKEKQRQNFCFSCQAATQKKT